MFDVRKTDQQEFLMSERLLLAARIDAMARAVGTRARAAEVAGITIQQLHNLTTGKNAPTLAVVARLAEASGSDLEWVVSGKGRRQKSSVVATPVSPVDPSLMGRIVDAIAVAYRAAKVKLPDRELGAMAADAYVAMAPFARSEDEQIAAANLVRSEHERRLAAETVVQRKRRA